MKEDICTSWSTHSILIFNWWKRHFHDVLTIEPFKYKLTEGLNKKTTKSNVKYNESISLWNWLKSFHFSYLPGIWYYDHILIIQNPIILLPVIYFSINSACRIHTWTLPVLLLSSYFKVSVSFGSVHSISLIANSGVNNAIERILAPFCHEICKTVVWVPNLNWYKSCLIT